MLRRRVGGPSGPVVSALCLGALPFGTTVDEKTSFAILDRFVEAGGDLIDTADNYAFWAPGGTGDESESTVGRWLASRRLYDKVVISTKVGARPTVPGSGLETAEGLSAPVIRKAAEASLRRLGTDRIDLYWTHIEDRSSRWRNRSVLSRTWSAVARCPYWAAPTTPPGEPSGPERSPGPTAGRRTPASSSATPTSSRVSTSDFRRADTSM